MSKEKRKGEYIPAVLPPEDIDPAVAEILADRERHFRELRLSPEERKRLRLMREKERQRKEKERAKALAREKNRITTYLPSNLIQQIRDIATYEEVSMSQVITFFVFDAVERYKRKELSFWGYKHPSKSPRYEWNLVHPADIERMEKIRSTKSRKSVNEP